MISELHIENIAVIKKLTVNFKNGFSVLTGETGAGKSVIIDGLSMLLGGRVSTDIIRSGESFAYSEALFEDLSEGVTEKLSALGIELEDGEVIISCKLTADGKSTVRVNGRAVTKTTLREIGKLLISIHGQNDSRVLFDKNAYILMTDAFGDLEGERLKYADTYRHLSSYKKKLSEINTDEAEKERLRDMLEYQIKDIDAKKLRDGEEEALEAEKTRLGSIEKINKHVDFAYRALRGGEKGASASYLLTRASDALNKIADVVPEAAEVAEKLTDMSYEISDMADRVATFGDSEVGNIDERLDKIENRLEAISSLKRKYGKDIRAILEFRKNAAERLDAIEEADERAAEYEKKIAELEALARSEAHLLSQKRVEAARVASERIMDVLSYLDMPKVSFKINVEHTGTLTSLGGDEVDFLVATNPGEPLQSMREIASGGEMARIMLAIKSVLNEKDGVGCIVYDEIDTGISGKTSRKIGVKLHDIAKEVQVLCVTHSAQIATLADNHYLISKREIDGRAQTRITLLDLDARVEEAARILGGINITDAQMQAARDMLANIDE